MDLMATMENENFIDPKDSSKNNKKKKRFNDEDREKAQIKNNTVRCQRKCLTLLKLSDVFFHPLSSKSLFIYEI